MSSRCPPLIVVMSPVEIISQAVWLYFRFCLSYRDVEELLFARGVMVTDELIRQWCRKFGQSYATQLRSRQPRPGDTWHLDEAFLTIRGKTQEPADRASKRSGSRAPE
jgi:putative transposase